MGECNLLLSDREKGTLRRGTKLMVLRTPPSLLCGHAGLQTHPGMARSQLTHAVDPIATNIAEREVASLPSDPSKLTSRCWSHSRRRDV